MTAAQSKLRSLRDRQSKERGRMAELGLAESLDDETRAELDGIEAGTADLERQLRAATVAVDDEDRAAIIERGTATGDSEARERVELRSRASVGRYLTAALRGGMVSGAEGELQQAAGLEPGQIPFELWQRHEQRQTEERAITAAPGTVGLNLDPLRPYVFAPSVVDKLMVEMPMVASGTYAIRHHHHGRDGGRGSEGWRRHDRRRAGNGRRVHGANHDPAPDRRQPQSRN